MKKTINAIFLFSLLVSLFLSSLQITVTKRQCVESGESAFVIFDADDCCPPADETGTSATPYCCEFSKITLRGFVAELFFQGFFNKISFPSFFVCSPHFSVHPQALFSSSVFFGTSPPKGVIQFLSLVRVFRI